jgi:hypothetical protein
MGPASSGVEVHAFRQRTSLFGHNAPDPNLMSLGARNSGSNIRELINTNGTRWKWKEFNIETAHLDLDTDNAKIVADSWVALSSSQLGIGSADLPGYTELFRVKNVSHRSRSDFGISGKITRIKPDTLASSDATENLTTRRFDLRRTLVLAQSEKLETIATPLRDGHHAFVDLHHHHVTHLSMAQHFAGGAAIAATDDQNPLDCRRRAQCRMNEHFMIVVLVAFAGLKNTVEHEHTAINLRVDDLNALMRAALVVQPVEDLQRVPGLAAPVFLNPPRGAHTRRVNPRRQLVGGPLARLAQYRGRQF